MEIEMAKPNEDNSKKELPLTNERLARIAESESKTFKGHGKEVLK